MDHAQLQSITVKHYLSLLHLNFAIFLCVKLAAFLIWRIFQLHIKSRNLHVW